MPGCIKKIDKKGGGFALMQNLERFQTAAKDWGVPVREVFQTVDLWERKNIPQVTLCIHALGRVVCICIRCYTRYIHMLHTLHHNIRPCPHFCSL